MNQLKRVLLSVLISFIFFYISSLLEVKAASCDPSYCNSNEECQFTQGPDHYGCYGENFGFVRCYDPQTYALRDITSDGPQDYSFASCYHNELNADARYSYCIDMHQVHDGVDHTNDSSWHFSQCHNVSPPGLSQTRWAYQDGETPPPDPPSLGTIQGSSNISTIFHIANNPEGVSYNHHAGSNPQGPGNSSSWDVFTYDGRANYTLSVDTIQGYNVSYHACHISGGVEVNCVPDGNGNSVNLPMDYSRNPIGGGLGRVIWTYTSIAITPTIYLRGRVIDEGSNAFQCVDLQSGYTNGVIVQLFDGSCNFISNYTTNDGPPGGPQPGYYEFTGRDQGNTYYVCGIPPGGRNFTQADLNSPVDQCVPMPVVPLCSNRNCIQYPNVIGQQNARLFLQGPTPTPGAVCAVPTLGNPTDGTCWNDQPTVSATRSGIADQLQFGVDDTNPFSGSLLWTSGTYIPNPANSVPNITPTPNTIYYWSARSSSRSNACSQSNWAAPRQYTIDRTSPNTPGTTASYVADINNPGKYFVQLSWNTVVDRSCGGMATLPYNSQLSNDPAFGSLVTGWDQSWTSSTNQITTTSFNCGTTFYGRVKARDRFPNETNWSTATQLTLPACAGDPNPIGNHDDPISCTQTHGFACDASNYSIALTVKFYKDGLFNPTPGAGGTLIGQANASQSHAASGFYCGGNSNHGFNFVIDPVTMGLNDGKNHTIYAYALGINPVGLQNGAMPLLSSTPKTINCLAATPTPGGVTPTPTPNGVTPTPTLTPTPMPWVQLKGTSYQTSGILSDKIPKNPLMFDGTAGQPYFIISNAAPLQDPGAVTSNGLDLGNSNANARVSQNDWKDITYHANGVSISSFINYIKSKKLYNLITDGDLNKVQANKINIFTTSIAITTSAAADKLYADPKTPIMIIMDNADITIGPVGPNPPFVFNPSKKPIVIVASTSSAAGGKITFTSTMAQANGIFISESFDTGDSSTLGIQIEGNVITNSLFQGRKWADNRKPAFYVVASPTMYISLFDFLSKPTYEWTQLK